MKNKARPRSNHTARKLFSDPKILPAIALHQPFAGAVRLCGFGYPAKRDETRENQTTRRGWVVICSTTTREDRPDVVEQLQRVGVPEQEIEQAIAPLGQALAIGKIVRIRPPAEASYERALYLDPDDPRYSWELDEIWPLSPFPVRCMPGFFPLDREQVIAHVFAQALRMLKPPWREWSSAGRPTSSRMEILAVLEKDLRS
jgi:hypothetical protein